MLTSSAARSCRFCRSAGHACAHSSPSPAIPIAATPAAAASASEAITLVEDDEPSGCFGVSCVAFLLAGHGRQNRLCGFSRLSLSLSSAVEALAGFEGSGLSTRGMLKEVLGIQTLFNWWQSLVNISNFRGKQRYVTTRSRLGSVPGRALATAGLAHSNIQGWSSMKVEIRPKL